MRVGAIVLARLDSRRLPNKALLELNGRPLIQYALEACAAAQGIDIVVLATTGRAEDDPLAAYADQQSVPCFRGAVDDVAGRFLAAMRQYDLQAGVRFNGDSPLNRPSLLAEAVAIFRSGDWDFVTNVPGRSFPFGISVEIVGLSAMQAAYAAMTRADEREHVTKFFYDHPEFARTHVMKAGSVGMSGLQLAVDDASDLTRIAWILRHLQVPLQEASLGTIVRLANTYATPRTASGNA